MSDNNNYRKWRYLMARKLEKLYCEKKEWSLKDLHKRLGVYFTAVNDETFSKYCKKEPVFEEELPVFIEALLSMAEEFRQVARLLETGKKRSSDYPAEEYPQYRKLIEIYKRRRAEQSAKKKTKK